MTIELVGWTLINSVWQGGAIAVFLTATLRLMRHSSASARYAVSIVALGAMIVVPVATTTMQRDRASTVVTGVPAAPVSATIVMAGERPVSAVPTTSRTEVLPEFLYARVVTGRLNAAFSWIVAAWLTGVVVLSLRLIGGVARTRRLAREGFDSTQMSVSAIAQRVAARLGIHSAVRILESTQVDVPMVVGWVAPVVLLPSSLLTGLTPAQLEMLLAHELAHVRRYDTIVNLAQRIVETLLFFHPAAWWISSRVREERESCCDDIALAITGGDRISYGATLLIIEELRGTTPMLATAATGGSLLRRIRRLVDGDTDHVRLGSRLLPVAIAILAALIVAGTIDARPFAPRATSSKETFPLSRTPTKPLAGAMRASPSPLVSAASGSSAAVTRSSPNQRAVMRRHSILIGAASLTLAAAGPVAQPKPNFAGKWTLVACGGCADSTNIAALRAKRGSASAAPGWGADVTILQDDANLTVVDSTPLSEQRTVYGLDEPNVFIATPNPDPTGRVTSRVRIVIRTSELTLVQSRPEWRADSLVIPLTGSRDSVSVAFTMTLFLNADGDLLAEWKVRQMRLNAGAVHAEWSAGQSPGFKGRNAITLRYKRT